MSTTTVTNFDATVTPEVTPGFASLAVDSAKRLTMDQAQALYGLIATFRPEWDRKTVLRQMQTTALYSPLEAHEVVTLFVNAATTATVRPFEDIAFPGVDPISARVQDN